MDLELQLLTRRLSVTVGSPLVFRNIVERSTMMNNDERVVYSFEEWKEVPLWFRSVGYMGSGFYEAKLIISRPHFECEGNVHLDKSKWQRDTAPPITIFLDDAFRLKKEIERYQFMDELCKRKTSPSRILASIIAHNFYDCMSAGMPVYMGRLIRELCSDDSIDESTEVYPRGDDCLTISDFMKEFEPIDSELKRLVF